METFYVCPDCQTENRVLYELEKGGYKPLDVTLDNDDNGLQCVGCRKELDASALYDCAMMDAVGA